MNILEQCRAALAAWRRRHDDRADYADLDGATLRDLGTSVSEIESWRVEADGRVERTRRRVATRSMSAALRTPLPEA